MLSEQYLAEVKLKRDEVPSFEQDPFNLEAVRNLASSEPKTSSTWPVNSSASIRIRRTASGSSSRMEGNRCMPSHEAYSAPLEIEKLFGGDQDIERATVGEQVSILQARPYAE